MSGKLTFLYLLPFINQKIKPHRLPSFTFLTFTKDKHVYFSKNSPDYESPNQGDWKPMTSLKSKQAKGSS